MTAGTRLDGAISPLQNPNPYRGDTHLNKGIFLVPSARLESQTQVHGSPLATSSFSSPASTPSLNGIFTTHSCTPSASISVSNSFEFVTALRSVSASPQISNGNALSSDALKLFEQREQQSPGRSIQVDSPPNEQQFIHGHQCQAIEGDDGTEPRISTILRNDQSDIPNSVASQFAAVSLPGNERYESVPFQDRSPLTGSGNQLSDQSECPAHYLGLMGNLWFDSPLTVIGGEPNGQSKRRSSVPAVCDPLTRAGPEIDPGDYIATTFCPNATASEISSDPIFGAVFGSWYYWLVFTCPCHLVTFVGVCFVRINPVASSLCCSVSFAGCASVQ